MLVQVHQLQKTYKLELQQQSLVQWKLVLLQLSIGFGFGID